MRFVRFVYRHPIVLLGACAAVFGAWVLREAVRDDQPQQLVIRPVPGPGVVRVGVADEDQVALPPGPVSNGTEPNSRGTIQVMSKLKPGMTWTEVEQLVGAPAPQDLHPATTADGKVIYRAAYEPDLGAPAVRPTERDRDPKSRVVVTLEFDATRPGHPLLGVSFSDPLF
jgi:hypothetical protein